MKINISDIKVEGNQIRLTGDIFKSASNNIEDTESFEITISAKSIHNAVNLLEEIKKLR